MKSPRPNIYYLLPAVFVLMLLLPHFNAATHIWQFERKAENRAFKDSLEIDLTQLDRFPNDFKQYFNDNFSFRTPLLNIYHHLKFQYFGISPHPEKTIIGKDDWYFMAAKEQKIVQGDLDFSQQDLDDFKDEWLRRKAFLDAQHIKCYWLIAPMKHHVYPELLPFNVVPAATRRVQQLKEAFSTTMPDLIIDPVPAFLTAKRDEKLFFRLDNHWNYHASHMVYNMLVDRLRQDFPSRNIPMVKDVLWHDTIIKSGIHYKVLGIEDLQEHDAFYTFKQQAKEIKKYGFPPTKGFAYPWEYEFRFTNDSISNGLRVLVVRDSFFENIMPLLSESAEESVYIFDAWQYQLNNYIVETVKPDVVIFESLEVHIETILNLYRQRPKQ